MSKTRGELLAASCHILRRSSSGRLGKRVNDVMVLWGVFWPNGLSCFVFVVYESKSQGEVRLVLGLFSCRESFIDQSEKRYKVKRVLTRVKSKQKAVRP